MAWYLDKSGNPYTGDRQPGDEQIPDRPDAMHVWDGMTWVIDAARHNAAIDAQIAALEARQDRPLREVALGIAGALERLQMLDSQISALRAQRL